MPRHVLLRLAWEKGVGGAMQVKSDTQLCVELARQATDWSIATLAVAPVSQLNLFDITGRTPVNLRELAAKRQADKETKQALAALRRLSQVPKPQRPSGAGGRGRGKGAGRSRGRGRAGEDAFARGGASSASSSGSAGSDVASQAPSGESGSEAQPGHPQAALPPDSLAPVARRNVRRGQVWGRRPAFQLAPVHRGGGAQQVGYEAICGLHFDPTKPGLQCKKAIASGLGEDECLLRLKRWLVAGLDSSSWPANARECHLSMGGVQLAQFAEGLGPAELDAAVSHQP